MSIELRVLKASHGDCIWIRYGDANSFHNIIIDSGPVLFKSDFKNLLKNIESKNEYVDLLVISHIDDDHLGGFSKWIVDERNNASIIKKLWFNTGNSIKEFLENPNFNNKDFTISLSEKNQQYGVKRGKDISQVLLEKGIAQPIIKAGHVEMINAAEITVLSPNQENLENLLSEWEKGVLKEGNVQYCSKKVSTSQDLDLLMLNDTFTPDTNHLNGSSIAFIFKYNDISIAFLADAHAKTIIEEKNKLYGDKPLAVNMMKLSHHGSSANTNLELLEALTTNNYIVSTKNALDKRTIARILKYKQGNEVKLYSNYDWWSNGDTFTTNDLATYITPQILKRIKLESTLIPVDGGLVIGND